MVTSRTDHRVSGADFDLDGLRRLFPGLRRAGVVYLDNAATTFACEAALDAWRAVYEEGLGSPARGSHPLSLAADEELARLREALRRHLGGGEGDGLVLSGSATLCLNLLAQGFQKIVAAGDLLVVSELEHHSNNLPWYGLAQRTGAAVAVLRVRDDGGLDTDHWQQILAQGPRLLTVTATSNVTGHRPDVRALAEAAHGAGAFVVLDAAQALPNDVIDFRETCADAMVVSAHKMGAPRGVAALLARRSLLDRLTPAILGGGMVHVADGAESVWAGPPTRFEAGTRDVALLRAWVEAFDTWHGVDGAAEHERAVGTYLRGHLEGMRAVDVLPSAGRCAPGLVSFAFRGVHPHDVAEFLGRRGICIRTGHMCAQPLVRRLGHVSVNRVSTARYTSRAEVDVFLDALEELGRAAR